MTTTDDTAVNADPKITLLQLTAMRACREQFLLVERWCSELGTVEVPINAQTIEQARSRGLDVAWLAQNPGCPADVLQVLAKDAVAYVRYGAAQNPGCPADVLQVLAKDADAYVRYAALDMIARRGGV